MTSVRKALALSFASKYSSLAIHTVAIMVLARLLTPAEIGVYSVGAAVVALAHVLRDFGVGNYLIQEKEMTQDRIRTAFGVALVIAWAMAAGLFALSGPAAAFYDEPGLRELLVVLSATFLVIPFGSPILALLRRDMAFGRLYVIDIASALAHATTAVTLASLGFSFMSLAWASLAGAVMTAVVAAFYRPRIARALPSFKEWRRVVRFGSISSATSMISQLGVNAIDLIIGRMLGFAAVGYYSRAQGLIFVFHRDILSAITSVTLPAFAIEHRENRNLKASYLKGVGFVTLFAWPFYGFLGLMAYPVVRILFGSQWDAAVPLVQILCVAVAIGASWNLISQMLVACGQVHRNLKSELIIQPSRIFMIVLAAPFGLEAVAGSQIIVYLIGMLVYYRHLFQVTDASVGEVLAATLPSLGVTLWSLVTPLLVFLLMEVGPDTVWLPFGVALFGSALGWIVGLMLSSHPAKAEVNFALNHLARRYL